MKIDNDILIKMISENFSRYNEWDYPVKIESAEVIERNNGKLIMVWYRVKIRTWSLQLITFPKYEYDWRSNYKSKIVRENKIDDILSKDKWYKRMWRKILK